MRNYTHGHGGRATLWRDAMFAVLREDGCAKMALRYGSQSKEVKLIQAWNHKHPYKKGPQGKHLTRR